MTYTINDVATHRNVNGELVALNEAERAAIRDEWNAAPPTPYDELRKSKYPSIDELVVALWEGVVEERMAAVTRLEGQRQAVKAKYPKDE